MSTLLLSLLLIFAALCSGEIAKLPQKIEIDLIFPRNNTSYIPTNYFPIVFAVQNAGTAWPLGLELSVEVRPDVPPFSGADSDAFHLGGDAGPTSGNATSDPSLLVQASKIITNTTEGRFFILWSYVLDNTCAEIGQQYASELMHISFNTSLGAAAPDIAVATESCPSQFSLIEVDRNTNTSIIDGNEKRCTLDMFSKNGTGGGDPCGLKPLAQTIATNVSRAMCVAENGTVACKSNAGLRLIQPGLGVGSLLVLVATISAICLSL